MTLRSDPVKHKIHQHRWHRKKMLDPAYRKVLSNRTREWQLRNPIQAALRAYLTRSKRKQIIFQLPHEEFEKLLLQNCVYCGSKPNPINTIDRLNPAGGYIVGNVLTACTRCNRAKNTMSFDEFKEWITQVYRHIGKEI